MAYATDLSEPDSYYKYWERPFSGVPLVNVGWMEPPHPMPRGDAPHGFAERLAAFCARDKLLCLECGHQDCGFCDLTYSDHLRRTGSPLGNGEIRVLGNGVVYAAPSLICHYVAAHSYLPPAEFVAAVMNGPRPDDPAYVKYRFYWWDATMQQAARSKGPPGSTLGPLVRRMRGMVWIIILMFAFGLRHPGGVLVTVPVLLSLAAVWMLLRTRLRCPVCLKRMTMPFREQPGWSSPPGSPWEHAWSTIYCNDCGVGLRASTALWGNPVAEVLTNWR